MTIGNNLTEFNGKPVQDFDAEKGIENPGGVCYRVRIADYDDEFSIEDRFTKFASDPKASEITEFIIGIWDYEMGGSEAIRDVILKFADKLPNVQAIMFGDITYEENEISWIENSHLTKLIMAFPNLTEFRIRGANELSVRGLKHPKIKKFVIESGGMSSSVITEVINADLPELEHLELWLGDENYGFDADVHQLRPLLTGSRFPKLKYLGLRDSTIADKIAVALGVADETDTASIELEGKNFVLTGTLVNMTRNDAKKKLIERGAKVGSGVTKNTDYLVAGDKAGSKLEKAKKLEIPVLTEADLFEVLGDEAEKAVSDAGTSILDRLQTLDLSMGALGDEGAKALFENPKIKNLDKLDLHYHYISDEWIEKLKTLDLVIDTSDQQDDGGDPEDRYISVAE